MIRITTKDFVTKMTGFLELKLGARPKDKNPKSGIRPSSSQRGQQGGFISSTRARTSPNQEQQGFPPQSGIA